VSDPILPLLVLIVVALLALGAAGRFFARGSRQAIGLVGAGLSGLGVTLTLLALIVGQEPGTMALPFGPPGLSLALSFDPLAAFFLLPAFLTGTASIAFAAEIADSSSKASLSGLSLCLAGVVLAILAADGVTLALGLALAGGAVWTSGDPGPARTPLLGVTALTGLAILGATAASGFVFAAMREQLDYPTALFVLALIGPGALAGLVPFHRWSIPAHGASPARAAALLSGALQPLALYLLVRLLLDLGGPAPAGWWGPVLLGIGSATALTCAWRAASEAEVGACLAGLTECQSGLAAIGIGLALIGRASDLPILTSLAQAAVLLLAFSQAVCGTLAQLAAGAVHAGAGSRRLVLLGGLIHSMPVVSTGMAAALFGFSAMPAGAGFAALWLLFQALLAAPHTPWMALVAAALAVSAALSGVASVRVFGVAFLGRSRGPRAAAASDIAKPARPAMLALASVAASIGLFPGVVLMLADPAIRQLQGIGLDDRIGPLGIRGYAVLPLVVVGLAICAGIVWLLQRRVVATPREGPAWNDGFAPPPAWLPFGDPLTQSAGEGFLPPLPKLPPLPRPGRYWRPRHVPALPILLAAMAVFLIALLWMAGA
jgi:hydrogenase-4 component B